MSGILVWDLPTRLFHWMFTATVLGALAIAISGDDESRFFQVHMLLGLLAGLLVLMRLVWGVAGSRYARFGSFLFGPRAVARYLGGVLRGTGERHVGHNPGSAYAIFAMLSLSLGLAVSGLLMGAGTELEEVHELLAYTMVLVIGAHLAGVVVHTIRHRENIALGMVTGRKGGEPAQSIASAHPIAGIVFLALAVGSAVVVFDGHDPQTGELSLFGRTLRLGEAGEANEEEERRERRRGRRRDRDDGDR